MASRPNFSVLQSFSPNKRVSPLECESFDSDNLNSPAVFTPSTASLPHRALRICMSCNCVAPLCSNSAELFVVVVVVVSALEVRSMITLSTDASM